MRFLTRSALLFRHVLLSHLSKIGSKFSHIDKRYPQALHRSDKLFGCEGATLYHIIIEPRREISNNVLCATSKASDQPAHMRSLIRAFASHLNILLLLTMFSEAKHI